jgi:O-antigen/teichoic acid export membrane protein
MIKQNTLRYLSGWQQSLFFIAALTMAFGLDYLFNLAAGRILSPEQFGIVVALAGVGQILVVGSRVIQTVVTRFVSRFLAGTAAQDQVSTFFYKAFGKALWWGLAATAVMLLLSPPLANFLQIPQVAPVLALAGATILMSLRPVVGGVLQGQQRFMHLGGVQIVQAGLRLALGILLMLMGLGAFGAMAALPLASLVALGVGLWFLRATLTRQRVPLDASRPDLYRYSLYTAAGLIGFALLINMDAILVKRFFDPVVAGHYGAAVTLAKVIQFFPVAIIMVLFPKAARRQTMQRDTRVVLFPALLAVGGVCGLIALVYFLIPDWLIGFVFGPAYSVPNGVLGLLGAAMLLLSLGNVWLNFYLSVERINFVYLIWTAVVLQAGFMTMFHDALWQLPAAMAVTGTLLTVAATAVYLMTSKKPDAS